MPNNLDTHTIVTSNGGYITTPRPTWPSADWSPTILPVMHGVERDGLLLLVDSSSTLILQCGFGRHMRLEQGRYVLHHPTDQPLRRAHEIRHEKGVLAVSVQRCGPITAADRLALVFADHLRQVRPQDEGRFPCNGAIIVSAKREVPGPSDNDVRLFHVMPIRGLTGPADHTVVWEWMSRPDAEAWFGGQLPDLRPLEPHIGELLDICQSARRGTLPDTTAGDALAAALRRHPFSGRFLLHNYNLMCRLLAERLFANDSGNASDPHAHALAEADFLGAAPRDVTRTGSSSVTGSNFPGTAEGNDTLGPEGGSQ